MTHFGFDYFISDTHFGHKGIIDMCHRPYVDVNDMDESIIENFNCTIKRYDSTVLWIGDVFFCNKQASIDILARLRGVHYLVTGNHDGNASRMMDVGFTAVMDRIHFRMGRYTFLACHYPYRKFQGDERFPDLHPNRGGEDFLLHGHTHSLSKVHSTMIHCGVDAWDFVPASANEILEQASKIKGVYNGKSK